jgi:hypothetical protein
MSTDLIAQHYGISPMSESAIERVREYESHLATLPQVDMPTHHVLHAGLYARTVMVPAGVDMVGAQIKLATVLIVSGHALVEVEGGTVELQGYHVLTASAGRKQAFRALADTHLTMLFATDARSVEAAEHEFTDDADRLMSRTGHNTVVITGD